MASREAEIDQVKLMQELTLVVTFKRTREMRARLASAAWLIKLAAWVCGMGVEVEHELQEEEQDDQD